MNCALCQRALKEKDEIAIHKRNKACHQECLRNYVRKADRSYKLSEEYELENKEPNEGFISINETQKYFPLEGDQIFLSTPNPTKNGDHVCDEDDQQNGIQDGSYSNLRVLTLNLVGKEKTDEKKTDNFAKKIIQKKKRLRKSLILFQMINFYNLFLGQKDFGVENNLGLYQFLTIFSFLILRKE